MAASTAAGLVRGAGHATEPWAGQSRRGQPPAARTTGGL